MKVIRTIFLVIYSLAILVIFFCMAVAFAYDAPNKWQYAMVLVSFLIIYVDTLFIHKKENENDNIQNSNKD